MKSKATDPKSCRECGQKFSLTNIEVSGYRMKELPVPDTCRACRNRSRSEETYFSANPSVLRRVENQ